MRQSTRHSRANVQLAVFDWAGTTVDFGCQAPVAAFIAGFKARGIDIDTKTARGPMGMEKRDHIKAVAETPAVARNWRQIHGNAISEADIDSLYQDFVPHLLSILESHSRVIPGVMEAVSTLRKDGIKIGSTTGYFKEAADIVAASAVQEGFDPDISVSSTDVAHGRPFPWMIYRVMEELNICPPQTVVNIGDTEVDMRTAQNAGVWSVGVAATGNEMGLTEAELNLLDAETRNLRIAAIRKKLYAAGAHWVIDTMDELPAVIEEINNFLDGGNKP